ncbi:MarR family winged helix-turn-helix transcriptional regulator [Clostridium polynesiense]|uniref:MarR family winged helix-turn-helix transcriptional regulator n=1 Tax=Clostridium polynesiense TaxID=1325933 RepID=UPI00058C338A|nr:MarR family transcriptional regulator [Clostridium polynesiense]
MDINQFRNNLQELFRDTSSKINNVFLPVYESCKLTMTQALLLNEIQRHGNTTIGELGRELNIARGNTSTMCKRLEKDGYITRTRDNKDERIVNVTLTEKGTKALDKLNYYLNNKFAQALENEDKDQIEAIINGIEKLNHILSKMEGDC